ncbi:MAG: hypothetical protein H6754_00535 [Candidatus Omnitrophica bacterium]|nr:hypothetical protein [Candidatus Omnitrophota bacterium]
MDLYHNCVCDLEGGHIFREIKGGLAHFPTWLLIIGYGVFWLELYVVKKGHGLTSPLAPAVALIILGILLPRSFGSIKGCWKFLCDNFNEQSRFNKYVIVVGSLLSLIILGCGFYASLFPPHLLQEHDLMHYRLAVPRQHLIMGSFAHIPWSAADFFYMPLDFALTPFWLATSLPNKFPQFLFILGLLAIAVKLVKHFTGNHFMAQVMVVFCILGSHNVGIQMGTGMLDLAGCYLLLAALHSFLEKNIFLCAAEFTFYFWSKSFIPPMMILIMIGVVLIFVLLKSRGSLKTDWVYAGAFGLLWKNNWPILKKLTGIFLVLSLLIGGPFVIKNLYYTGTPTYPFVVGLVPGLANLQKDADVWQIIESNAYNNTQTKDAYGHGRSWGAFLSHLWLISVPEQGVNNSYDYPVGLIYLLCLGPFLLVLFRALRHKEFLLVPVFVVVFWMVWWFTSQQSRFLYIPIVLMIIVVVSDKRFLTPVFYVCVFVALTSTCLSIVRAHKADWGKSAYEVLRPRDKILLTMSKNFDGLHPLMVDHADVAFADFPVIIKNKGILVLK